MNPLFYLKKSTTVRAGIASLFKIVQENFPAAAAELALRQFTNPSAIKMAALAPLEQPLETFVKILEGQKIFVYRWGARGNQDRGAVLLSHGWASNAFDLYLLVEGLQKTGFRVYGFDQVAHGKSGGTMTSLPQFARILESVGRDISDLRAVIGHSMGAAAATIALQRGLPGQAVVLVSPPADMRVWLTRYAQSVGLQPKVLKALEEKLEKQERFLLDRARPEETAPGLRLPALLITDRHDKEVPHAHSLRYRASWGGECQLLVTEGWGHRRILGAPQVSAAITSFLARALPGVAETSL